MEPNNNDNKIPVARMLLAWVVFAIALASSCLGAWQLGLGIMWTVHHAYLFLVRYFNH